MTSALSARATVLTALVLLFGPWYAFGSGITYHGRLLNPDSTPVTDSSVQFKMDILTPDSQSCLMYEELQTKNLSSTSGAFAITINDGTGTRTDSSGYTFDQVFGNIGTLTFAPATCSSGTGSYTPATGDGRTFQVYFKTSTMSTWEPMPAQSINFSPFAIEAKQVSGFPAASLLRVQQASGAPGTATPLSPTDFTNLQTLLAGTSTQYVQSGTNGAPIPSLASNPGTPSAGDIWFNSTSKTLDYYDGTSVQTVGTGTGAGTVTSVATGTGLTGGPITSSGTISLASVGTAGTYTKVTTDAYGRVTAGTQITGNDITSGTIGGTTAMSTTGNVSATNLSSTTDSTNNLWIYEPTNTHKVKIKAPASLSADYGLTLPTTEPGANGYMLISDTSGNLSWAAPSSGSVTNVATGTGLIGGPISTSGTISLAPPSTSTIGGVEAVNQAAHEWIQYIDTTGVPHLAQPDLSDLTGTANVFLNGGNSFGAAASLGTNDANTLSLKTNNATRMTLDSAGNVGIGTTSPIAPLDVESSTTASSGTSYGMKVLQNVNESGTAGFSTLVVEADITATAAAPTDLLELKSGSSVKFNVDQYGGFNFGGFGNIYGALGIAQGTTVGYAIGTTPPTNGLAVSGNVGIGTTSPGGVLDVEGGTAVAGVNGSSINIAAQNAGSGNQNGGNITLTAGNATGTGTYGAIQLNANITGASGILYFGANSGSDILLNSSGADYGTIQNDGANVWSLGHSTNRNTTLGSPVLSWTGAGNVGIGTTSPTAALQLKAGVATAGGAPLKLTAGTSLTTPEPGAIEYDGASLYYTDSSSVRHTLAAAGSGITALTGDVTASGSGSVTATVNKVNGVAYSASPTTNTVPVVTGSNTVTYEAVPNAALQNSSVTLGSTAVSLGSTASSLAGLTSVGLGVDGTTAGSLSISKGSGGGASVTLQNNAATTAYNFNLPATAGTAGQVLTSQGGGTSAMTWTTPASGTVTNVATGTGLIGGPITSTGTISLAPPSVTTIGGVEAVNQTAHEWVQYIDTTGVPHLAQPDFSDLTGASNVFLNGGNSFGAAASLGTNDANTLSLKTNNTTRMTFDTAGNVGIGTTSPTDALDVVGNVGISNGVLQDSYSSFNSSVINGLGVNNSISGGDGGTITLAHSRSGGALLAGDHIGEIQFNGTDSANAHLLMGDIRTDVVSPTAGSAQTKMVFETMGGSSTLADRMTIDQNGNVGIGTTSPSSVLEVHGGTSTFWTVVNVWDPMTVGTPDAGVYSPTSSTVSFPGSYGNINAFNTGTTAGTGSYLQFTSNGGSSSFIGSIQPSSGYSPAIVFDQKTGATAYAERMRIDQNGNVGIGITSPTAALQLKAGVATAGGAPLKLTAGTSLTTPEPGAIEYDGTSLFYTDSSSVRHTLAAAGAGITALTGDVTASGSGSVAATVNSVGGSTAANVHTAEVAANAATNANTASTIVKRDASGNFSAGAVSVGSSIFRDSGANTVTLEAPTTVTSYVLKLPASQGASGTVLTEDGSGNLSWLAPTVTGATLASGDIWVGNGSNVATAVAMSGDATLASSGTLTLAPSGVTAATYGSATQVPQIAVDAKGRITSASNVSIPTATGAQLGLMEVGTGLSVAAGVVSVANTGATGAYLNGGNSFGQAATLGTNDAYTLGFKTNGTTQMTIDTVGRVGIGSASPTGTLDVEGGTAASGSGSSITIDAQAAASGNNNGGNIVFQPGAATGTGQAGRFVVGSTTPHWFSNVLGDFVGNSANPSPRVVSEQRGAGASTGYPGFMAMNYMDVAATGEPQFIFQNARGTYASPTAIQSGDSLGDMIFTGTYDASGNPGVGANIAALADENWTSSANGAALTFSTTSDGTTSQGERMRISSAGNVGIGTTSPSALLDIYDTVNADLGYPLSLRTTGGGGTGIMLDSTPTGSGGKFGVYISGSGSSITPGSFIVKDFNGSGEIHRLVISPSGNVGIGTTSPTAALQLKAGVATAGGAPLKLTAGTSLTTPEPGAIEYDGTSLFYTDSSSVRHTLAAAGAGITALTGDVTASGSGSVAATVNSVGGSTAANVHTAELAANAATNANTASTIVKRDASGNFSAGAVSVGSSIFRDSGANTITLEAPTTVTSYILKLPASQGTANTVLTEDGSGNLTWSAPVVSGAALTTGDIWVGSGGVATPVAMSGDATLSSSGTLTLASSGVTAATYGSATQVPQIAVDAKGRITSASNVSIPTATTGQLGLMEVGTGLSVASGVVSVASTGATGAYLNGGNSFGQAATLGTNDANTLGFLTNGSPRMTIDTAGNVGIGTTSPGAMLDVGGVVNAHSLSVWNGIVDSGTWGAAYTATSSSKGSPATSGGPNLWLTDTSVVDSSGTFAELGASNSAGIAQTAYIGAISSPGAAVYSPTIVIGQQTGSTAYAERMRIDQNGNVGIGTSTPHSNLSFSGQSAQTIGMERETTASAPGNNLTIAAGGATPGGSNVSGGNLYLASGTATGNASSSILLQVPTGYTAGTADNTPTTVGTFNNSGLIVNGSIVSATAFPSSYASSSASVNAPNGSWVAESAAIVENGQMLDNSASYLTLQTRNTAGNNQNTYIGNVSVSGAGSYTPIMVFGHSTGANAYVESMRIDQNGNVGIGTTSPTAALQLKAGVATAGGAPLKLTAGTSLTTPEPGAIEYDGTSLFYTDSSSVRHTLAAAGSGITALTGDVTASGSGSVAATLATTGVTAATYGSATQVPQIAVDAKGRITSAANVTIQSATTGQLGLMEVGSGLSVASGVVSLASTGATGAYLNGGNSFGQAATLGTNDANTLGFKTNGTTQMTIDTAGNVGIGTTTPGYPLDVWVSGSRDFAIVPGAGVQSMVGVVSVGGVTSLYSATGSSSQWPYAGNSWGGTVFEENSSQLDGTGAFNVLQVQNTNGNYQTGFIGAVSNTGAGTYSPAIVFGQATGSSAYKERMRIDQNGNVGIGTTSPANTLSVVGGITTYTTAGASSGIVATGTTGNNFGNAAVEVKSATGNADYALSSGDTIGSTGVPGVGLWDNKNGTLPFIVESSAPNNALVVASTGNVGIGTASPTAALQLKAGVATAGGAPLKLIAGTSLTTPEPGAIEFDGTSLYYTDSSSARHALAAAGADLSLAGGTMTGQLDGADGTAASPGFSFSGDTGTGFYDAGSHTIGVSTNGTESMILSSTGITGSAAMTIAAGGTSNLTLSGGTGGNVILSPNVGIGTTSPIAPLDVEGTITQGAASTYYFGNHTLMDVEPTAASSANGYWGSFSRLTSSSANITSQNLYGSDNSVQLYSGGTSTVNSATGATGNIANYAGRTLSYATGGSFGVQVDGSGSITSATGVAASVTQTAGTIGTAYGVNIGSVQGTSKWSLYASDSTAPSYFAGNVGIGTTSPATSLDVNGSVLVEGSNSINTQITNDTTTGTTVNKLAKLSAGKAVKIATTDSTGILGIVAGGAGTSGSAQIAVSGQALCAFDGATTQGHYVAASASTAGDCHDAGATYPSSGQILGRVLSSNAAAGTYGVLLYGAEIQGSAPGAAINLNAYDNLAYTSTSAASDIPGDGGQPYLDLINNTNGDGEFSVLFGQVSNTAGSGQSSYIATVAATGASTYSPVIAFGQSTGVNAYAERMRIDQNGNVGIGTTSPGYVLDVAGAARATGVIYTGTNGAYIGDTSGNGTLALVPNNGIIQTGWGHDFEVMNGSGGVGISLNGSTSSYFNVGNVGIGTTSPGYPLDVVGDIRTSTCLHYASSTIGTCSSDERLKKDIKPYELGLKELVGINPVMFKYNGLGGLPADGKTQVGVIAQQVEKVAPQLVGTKELKLHENDKSPTVTKTVDYGAFTYMLINSVKSLYKQITGLVAHQAVQDRDLASLKSEIAAKDKKIQKLEQENAAIKARVDRQEKDLQAIKRKLGL